MVSQSAFVSPATANSSVPRGKGAEVAFIGSIRSAETRFTAKTPLSSIASTESFRPVEANMTCGGT